MATIPSAYNDRLVGSKDADDIIDGLAGLDSVSYDGNFADYKFTVDNGVFAIKDNRPAGPNNDGKDSLINIEKILFLGDQKQLSLSTESIVNAEASGEQTDTTVIALPTGGYINFWHGKVTVTEKVVDEVTNEVTEVTRETLGYYFRQFDTNGIAQGLDKKILADVTSAKAAIQPAKDQNGNDTFNIILAWSAPDADKNGISVQIFNADGTEKSEKFRANDTLIDEQVSPAIAVMTDDSFVVSWTSANQGDAIYNEGVQMGGPPNQAGVFSQHFDSSGNQLGWEMKVSESGGSDSFVTALDGGGYMIVHEAIEGGSEKMAISANFYDKDDNLLRTFYTVNPTLESTKSEVGNPIYNELASREKLPTATKLGNGNVVIVWQAPRDAYDTPDTLDAHDSSIIARLFTPTGEEITGEIVVNNFTLYEQMQPAIASLAGANGFDDPTGGFVVVWQSLLQDTSYWGIYGQRFDADGNKVGAEFQVNTKIHDSQQQPTVTGLADGGFVVAWEGQYQDGNQQGSFQAGDTASEIVQQRFDAEGNALGVSVAGGNADDTITITGSGAIEIAGGLGKDTLTSGDGDDTLRGNNGNDILDGGKGNNIIIGGDGSDILMLAGNFEDYTISGSNGKYLIEGIGSFAGLHDFVSSVETVEFGNGVLLNLDDEQSGGTAGKIVTGESNSDGVAETLTGSSGDDEITGGNLKGPADTLQGGNGNDLYIAAGNYMIIYDTSGNDTLRIASHIDLSNPVANKKTQGLDYIDNVELDGKAALNLIGNSGDNKLTGNLGANKINGGSGNDTINGGLGKDKLNGGAGLDTFVFDTAISKSNFDTITDFSSDKIQLDSRIFTGLDEDGDGKLTADQFLSGAGRKAAPADTASFLVYDTNTGYLYYDAEGSKAVAIAKVGVFDLDANGKMTTTFHAANLTNSVFEII